jgi:serine/threonine-protein kinase
MHAADRFPPGTVIAGRFRIDQLLGQGGYGSVFAATQLNLSRRVALKIMHPDVLRRPEALARFEREAVLTQQLAHPNTVRLFDFGRTDQGVPFIVWELLVGRSLERELATAGPLPVARVRHITQQVLKALMEAHGMGIVHRDIKPANIFLSDFAGEPDFVKVLDFGIAHAPSGSGGITAEGVSLGTPTYMAPEQVMDTAVDGRTDLYSLGLVMAELLAGEAVFRGVTAMQIAMMQIDDKPVPLAPLVQSSPLGPIIVRATQKDPARRFSSAFEMLDVLRGDTSSAPPRAPGRLDTFATGPTQSGEGIAYQPTIGVATPAGHAFLPGSQPPLPRAVVTTSASAVHTPSHAPTGTLDAQLVPPAPRRKGLSFGTGILLGAVGLALVGGLGWAAAVSWAPTKKTPKKHEQRDETSEERDIDEAMEDAIEDSIKFDENGIEIKVPGAKVSVAGCKAMNDLDKFVISGVGGATLMRRLEPLGYNCASISANRVLGQDEATIMMFKRSSGGAMITFRQVINGQCTGGALAKDPDTSVNVCILNVDKPEAQKMMGAMFGTGTP